MTAALSTDAIAIRPVRDEDGPPAAALIAACFAEHPGCLYEPSEFPELLSPAAWCASRGTRMWVALDGAGALVGCICATPHDDGTVELHKFYVAAHLRGGGLARTLSGLVFETARETKAGAIFLWTDTRFTRAHRFYEKLGLTRLPETRLLHDVSNTEEFHYGLALNPAASA